jgi:NADH dehydrogenase [ubiquinone] 1 alpha subcomplex assembly factor 6
MLPMLKIRNISTIDSNVDYCVQLVKTHDYENFLVGLMIARKHRASFYTIKAFNIEIAMIKDQSKGNSNTGRLRFKWWQDVIEEIYNSNSEPKNPVGAAMATMVRDKGITRRWFQNVIEARQKDLYVAQPSTLSELEDYCERSHSSLLYMLLESMQINDENTEYMASHVGVGYGLTVLLRGTIHHLANVSH